MLFESTNFQIWYNNHIKNEPWYDTNVRFCDGSKQRFIQKKINSLSKDEKDELLQKYNQYRVL